MGFCEQVRTFLQPPIRGVVLQTYGAGNLPGNRSDIMAELKAATDRGVIVINCSQCFKGSVTAVYQTGHVRKFRYNSYQTCVLKIRAVKFEVRVEEKFDDFDILRFEYK